jgi:hypothetical protein
MLPDNFGEAEITTPEAQIDQRVDHARSAYVLAMQTLTQSERQRELKKVDRAAGV